jgi:glycosyltransferase involved in cell wall biosynthesis
MRVLVFNHFAVPRGQPGGTRHVELFTGLPGWSATVIASRLNLSTGRPQDPAPGFVPVRVIPYRRNGLSRVLNWISYAATATLAGLRQPRPDVVYASSPHLLAGLAGWFVATVRRARFVLEIRDLWPQVLVDMGQLPETSLIYRLLTRVERFLYARADRIVVMATGSRPAVEAKGAAPEKIWYIPNAADPEDFRPTAAKDELRRRYGFTRFTAVYAGAHGPANGLGLLLNAAEQVRDLDLDLVLVGDGVSKASLIADARARKLTNVRFLAPVPKAEIPDLLHAADLGLHVLADVPLFQHAVSPNKVFDYLAAGLPVLTNVPGVVAECVIGAGAGHAVPPDGLGAGLRRTVEQARIDGGSELRRSGRNGKSWIAANQTRAMMRERLLDCLAHAPERAGARSPV